VIGAEWVLTAAHCVGGISVTAKDGLGGPGIESAQITGMAWNGDSDGAQLVNGVQVGVCSTGDGESYQVYASVANSRAGFAPPPVRDNSARQVVVTHY